MYMRVYECKCDKSVKKIILMFCVSVWKLGEGCVMSCVDHGDPGRCDAPGGPCVSVGGGGVRDRL